MRERTAVRSGSEKQLHCTAKPAARRDRRGLRETTGVNRRSSCIQRQTRVAMNHASRVSLLLGLLFAAAPAAARAQSAPSSAPAAAQSAPTETPEAWSAKPVGGYRLVLFDANPDGP